MDGEEKTCQGFKVILVKAEYAKTLSQRRVALEQVYADGCYIEGMVWKRVEDRVALVSTFRMKMSKGVGGPLRSHPLTG